MILEQINNDVERCLINRADEILFFALTNVFEEESKELSNDDIRIIAKYLGVKKARHLFLKMARDIEDYKKSSYDQNTEIIEIEIRYKIKKHFCQLVHKFNASKYHYENRCEYMAKYFIRNRNIVFSKKELFEFEYGRCILIMYKLFNFVSINNIAELINCNILIANIKMIEIEIETLYNKSISNIRSAGFENKIDTLINFIH